MSLIPVQGHDLVKVLCKTYSFVSLCFIRVKTYVLKPRYGCDTASRAEVKLCLLVTEFAVGVARRGKTCDLRVLSHEISPFRISIQVLQRRSSKRSAETTT
jgi:hypothetical protein